MPAFKPYIYHVIMLISQIVVIAAVVVGAQPILTAQQTDEQKNKLLEFPIENNSIDAQAFYDAVLSKSHWTTDLAQKIFAELNIAGSVVVHDINGRIPVSSLSILTSLFPGAFEIVHPNSQQRDGPPSAFRVDMDQLISKWGDQKLSLRNWLARRSQNPLYEVDGKNGFDGFVEKRRLTIVLSGLHGGEESASKFAKAIHEQTKTPSCVFRYPNDAPIEESSDYLLHTLSTLHAECPNRSITLVAHSMGGLIVRDVIERHHRIHKEAATFGIDRVVLICPPNQGSVFAEYAGVLEVAEQLQSMLKLHSKSKILSAVLDGFNEAPKDLVPGSEFLQKLHGYDRHPRIKYTVLAGDAGLIDTRLISLGGELLELLSGESHRLQPLQERAKKLLNSPELQAGSGDGVVALSSAKLEGVDDFEVLPINHLEWAELSKASGQRVLSEVVERITSRSF